ncbi:transmembrane 220 family protein [Daejeonella sp.]|uniref:transmembrane 220 family protein n=1 Tax=Daejeonella sp. TaxID=2805397 RepID=UPI0025C4FB26|nr:transmembrane 220 family protein [Daejeonella sp.]
MKIFNLVFCLLFIVSAGLQYNDPDPYLWIPIYLIGALISFKAFQGVFFPRLSFLFSGLLFIYSIYLFFDRYGVLTWIVDHQAENIAGSMKATTPWIEETREFFGLIILIIMTMANYIHLRYFNRKHISS